MPDILHRKAKFATEPEINSVKTMKAIPTSRGDPSLKSLPIGLCFDASGRVTLLGRWPYLLVKGPYKGPSIYTIKATNY